MRLAANLSTQFAAGPWPNRVARAAAAGFRAIEAQWPYGECSPGELADAFTSHGVSPELLNAPVGTEDSVRVGFAAVPGAEEAFRGSIDMALEFATNAGFPRIHVLCGAGSGTRREALLDNLAWASDRAGEDAVLVIEAINRIDVPGYHLAGVQDAAGVLRTLNRANVRLLFDFYHAWRNGEWIADAVAEHIGWIAHVQISDHPGRGEPGSGEIAFLPGLRALYEAGYAGAVGCEFRPSGPAEVCLDWARTLGFDLMSGGVFSR